MKNNELQRNNNHDRPKKQIYRRKLQSKRLQKKTMTKINNEGYITRNYNKRNWWLIKNASTNRGYVDLGIIHTPKHLIGKKIRFKIEIIQEGETK